jgi:hypothetical protein
LADDGKAIQRCYYCKRQHVEVVVVCLREESRWVSSVGETSCRGMKAMSAPRGVSGLRLCLLGRKVEPRCIC